YGIEAFEASIFLSMKNSLIDSALKFPAGQKVRSQKTTFFERWLFQPPVRGEETRERVCK
ncbi:hypothetical protein, partial [Aggregatibacter actinomycetemcomitans]|uniref:hypothetical protein n=1 Tax=Aggregatibacter actinomycetemcomitans TaxID=714 RepID=UPI001E616C9E